MVSWQPSVESGLGIGVYFIRDSVPKQWQPVLGAQPNVAPATSSANQHLLVSLGVSGELPGEWNAGQSISFDITIRAESSRVTVASRRFTMCPVERGEGTPSTRSI